MQVRIARNETLCIPLIIKEATEKVMNFERYVDKVSKRRTSWAELGQSQLQLELGFTLNKVCYLTLMITNYHYIS